MNTLNTIRARVYTEQGIKVVTLLLVVLAVIGLEFMRFFTGVDFDYSVLFVAVVTGITTYFFASESVKAKTEFPKTTVNDILLSKPEETITNADKIIKALS